MMSGCLLVVFHVAVPYAWLGSRILQIPNPSPTKPPRRMASLVVLMVLCSRIAALAELLTLMAWCACPSTPPCDVSLLIEIQIYQTEVTRTLVFDFFPTSNTLHKQIRNHVRTQGQDSRQDRRQCQSTHQWQQAPRYWPIEGEQPRAGNRETYQVVDKRSANANTFAQVDLSSLAGKSKISPDTESRFVLT